MGGPGEGGGDVGEHVMPWKGEGVENEFACPDMVARIPIIEEIFPHRQAYLEKNRQEQEVRN